MDGLKKATAEAQPDGASPTSLQDRRSKDGGSKMSDMDGKRNVRYGTGS